MDYKQNQTILRRTVILEERVVSLKLHNRHVVAMSKMVQHTRALSAMRLKASLDLKMCRAANTRARILKLKSLKSALEVQKAKKLSLAAKLAKMTIDSSSEETLYEIEEVEFYLPSMQFIMDMPEQEYKRLLKYLPPINRFTLRELGIEEIITNENLRHEVVFEENLKFKPNLMKNANLNEYWDELQIEIRKSKLSRVPLLLLEIREIILELIPIDRDTKKDIESSIDVVMIERQIKEGQLTKAREQLEYICSLLKEHCAPARDSLVDQVFELASIGQIVPSLKLCFEVLELMKLDFANYQLEIFRPHMLKNSIEYERKMYNQHVETLEGTALKTKNLIESILKEKSQKSQISMLELITKSVLSVISCTDMLEPNMFPETMRLDNSRLTIMHNDLQDIAAMGCLMLHYRQWNNMHIKTQLSQDHMTECKNKLWVLLNDSDVTLEHMSLFIMRGVSNHAVGNDVVEKNKVAMCNTIENMLSAKSQIFKIIKQKTVNVLEVFLITGKMDDDLIASVGLLQMKEEILSLGNRLKKFIGHHTQVYTPVYEEML